MPDDRIYAELGRFIPQQEIDEGIDRIVNPEKYKRKEIRKEILQSLAGGLIGGAIAVAIILGATKYIEQSVKTEKVTNVKQQPTNPVATAAYNNASQDTL